MSASTRKTPLSVEALLAKQKEEAAVKPKFMTKAEREKLALEKREAEINAQKKKEEEEARKREDFERKAREEARARGAPNGGRDYGGRDDYGRYGDPRRGDYRDYDRPRYDDQDRDFDRRGVPTGPRADRSRGEASGRHPYERYNDRDAPHNVPTGPRSDRERVDHNDSRAMPPPAGPSANGSSYTNGNKNGTSAETPVTEAEQELIKQRYLGASKGSTKKPRRKLNDKKFLFDWDQTEDTSDKINPVYETSLEATVFGAGGRGGIDPAQRAGDATTPAARDPLDKPRRSVKSAFDEKHWSEKRLEDMKERDWRIFREDFAIAARGGHIPRPLRSWKESSIPPSILRAIEEIGYADPSPIQRQAIPIGLQNRDLIGLAETGSGKTASFVIPMLSYISELPKLSDENRHLGPYALILAPTRELAQQIEGETRKFATQLGFTCVSIVGGRDMNEQAISLRNGAEIVIATPGRLKDCVERHVVVLSQCTYVVMDEADRMVNLGFEDVLNYILDSLPVSNLKPDTDDSEDPLQLLRKDDDARVAKYRVTMLYSATMPPSVERMARKYLRRPATIVIGDANQAVGTVEQNVEFIQSEDKKKSRLLQILSSGFEPPIIVFVNQKKTADLVGKDIQRAGWNVATLHSGKTQEQREAALESLRSGEAPILVATDLAGRGIDVPDVSLVINYQMSNHIEAYVHRIGRTGRAGKRGVAITFLENADEELFYDLKQEISKSPVSKLSPELARHPSAQTKMTREMIKRKREDD